MSEALEEDPFELFKRVEKSLSTATASMERLAAEQDARCKTISDAAGKPINWPRKPVTPSQHPRGV